MQELHPRRSKRYGPPSKLSWSPSTRNTLLFNAVQMAWLATLARPGTGAYSVKDQCRGALTGFLISGNAELCSLEAVCRSSASTDDSSHEAYRRIPLHECCSSLGSFNVYRSMSTLYHAAATLPTHIPLSSCKSPCDPKMTFLTMHAFRCTSRHSRWTSLQAT